MGKTYLLTQLISMNYRDVKSICSVDPSLLSTFALAFVDLNKQDFLSERKKVNLEGWQSLVSSLEDHDDKDNRVSFSVLIAILALMSQGSRSKNSIRHLKPLHFHLMRTDLVQYLEKLRAKGWLEEALTVLKRGLIFNRSIMIENYFAGDREPRQSLIRINPDKVSDVSFVNLVHPKRRLRCQRERNRGHRTN